MKKNEIYFNEEYKMWWPVFDHNPAGNYKTIMSGIVAIDEALKFIDGREYCIQAGGHLGYWPNKLIKHFKTVWTFEADPIVFRCLARNIESFDIIITNMALAETDGAAKLYRGRSAGSSRLQESGEIIVTKTTIDSYNLPACDAIFLDIEGGEVNAILGARATIQKFKPVIIVEELDSFAANIANCLNNMGYKKVTKIGRDAIWKAS